MTARSSGSWTAHEITERALVAARSTSPPSEGADAAPESRHVNDWRYRFSEHKGTLLAIAIFCRHVHDLLSANHPATALPPTSCQTAANKGVLLALVAMAQTLVVITVGHRPFRRHGIHSVAIAWPRLSLSARPGTRSASASLACSVTGLLCGAINGVDRHFRTPAADRDDNRHRRHLFRRRAGVAAQSRRGDFNWRPRRRDDWRCSACMPASLVALARRRVHDLGALSAAPRSAGPPMRSALPRSPPICPACRSAAPNSSPIRCPAF